VQVIPSGIDLLLPSLEPRDPAVPLRLGFVGRFHPNKGLDLLLDWVNATRNKGINATLTLRGRQDPDMPEYWTHIQDRIAKENLSHIIKLDGWLSGADIYKDLDVILVPSHIPDPGPLVVAEAMSAGVVVAGYPAGGIPFSIENGVSGFLLRKPNDVAEALHGLVSEPGKFNQMRFAGHARVKSMFSMETFHRRTADVYHQILKQPPEKVELANTMSTDPA
jgi:glycosyltransferase involved in cell wall biosynthesis